MEEKTLEREVLEWLAAGKGVGLSGKAICFAALDIPPGDNYDLRFYPRYPSDFNRCLLLLDKIPRLRGLLYKAAGLSRSWKNIVEHWDEIEALFYEELGRDRKKSNNAQKTYDLLKSLRERNSR